MRREKGQKDTVVSAAWAVAKLSTLVIFRIGTGTGRETSDAPVESLF